MADTARVRAWLWWACPRGGVLLGAAAFAVPQGPARNAICVLAVLVSVVAVLTGAWAHPSDHARSGDGLAGLVGARSRWHTRSRLGRRLAYRALHDPLTGLANLDLLVGRLEHALRQPVCPAGSLAVVLIDLDDFKTVNDALSHSVGDQLLAAAGARVASLVTPSDTVARVEDDEFAVLLEGADSAARAQQIAERVLAAFKESFELASNVVYVGASIGIGVNRQGDQAISIIKNADMALHAAKSRGRSQVVTFEAEMHESGVKRLNLRTDMRLALERGEFVSLYQPIVDLESGRMVAVEALVRWDHPTRGLLSPADFIDFAEESGLIVPMGLEVFRRACRQAYLWNGTGADRPPVRINVNLSARQVQAPGLVEDVQRILASEQAKPAWLTLEITESVLLVDADASVDTLVRLKVLGLSLAIDDFGTGYSSLSYLQRLPVDVLKLDKSFVDQLGRPGGGSDSRLAGAIIGLGLTMDLVTTAEGVEHSGQLRRLRQLGCHLGQGYFFARPLRPEEVSTALVLQSGRVMAGAGNGPERGDGPY